jgi:hypothetical protein
MKLACCAVLEALTEKTLPFFMSRFTIPPKMGVVGGSTERPIRFGIFLCYKSLIYE